MNPFKILFFFISTAALLIGVSAFFPEQGIKIGDAHTLHFYKMEDFNTDQTPKIKDVEVFLKQYETLVDSTAILDSMQREALAIQKQMLRIQWPEGQKIKLDHFFSRCESLKSQKDHKVRVMHFGDSQIEGDRITNYLRNEWQKEYGGYGPGLIPMTKGIPSGAYRLEQSDNWLRYTLYGRRDTLIKHNRFAPLGVLARFQPPTVDSIPVDTTPKEAWVAVMPSRMGYSRVKKYTQISLFYGFVPDSLYLQVYSNDTLIRFYEIPPEPGLKKMTWTLGYTPERFTIETGSRISPEFYALSLESQSGLIVDNIAMRGSSGTLFKKFDRRQFSSFLQNQPVALLILQFGGNSVPYIKSEQQAKRYGKWFAAQLAYLKALKPHAAILVIGPSDMATKVKDRFITYPMLEEVRDALKNAAFETGCGFWDLYEVMGGNQSMTRWVESDPPLAGKDYVHFTPRGSKKVAELLVKALKEDQAEWEARKDSIVD